MRADLHPGISLSHVLQESSYVLHLPVKPSQALLVRAIRTQSDCPLQVRMLVSSPSTAVWYGKESTSKDDLGGYEIRRKDWSDALSRIRNSTRNEWEARTVYMVRFHPVYGVARVDWTCEGYERSESMTAHPCTPASSLGLREHSHAAAPCLYPTRIWLSSSWWSVETNRAITNSCIGEAITRLLSDTE